MTSLPVCSQTFGYPTLLDNRRLGTERNAEVTLCKRSKSLTLFHHFLQCFVSQQRHETESPQVKSTELFISKSFTTLLKKQWPYVYLKRFSDLSLKVT